jgi:hypothetical protein
VPLVNGEAALEGDILTNVDRYLLPRDPKVESLRDSVILDDDKDACIRHRISAPQSSAALHFSVPTASAKPSACAATKERRPLPGSMSRRPRCLLTV